MKVSNCCGVAGGWQTSVFYPIYNTWEAAELCPHCGQHCEYVDEDETDLNTINTENEQRTDED